MARSLEQFFAEFPNLTALIGERPLREKVERLSQLYQSRRNELARAQRGHSRGFWNTLLIALYEEDPLRRAAEFRLRIIESGLAAAHAVGKRAKFKDALTTDDGGFHQVVAELFCLSAVHRTAASYDIERAGRVPPKNYDLHLVNVTGAAEIHLDSKWRTETPVGEAPDDLLSDMEDLLVDDLKGRSAIISLRRNTIRDDARVRLAQIVATAARLSRAEAIAGIEGVGVTLESMAGLTEDNALVQAGFDAIVRGVEATYLKGEAFEAIVVAEEGRIIFGESEAMAEIEFYGGDGGIAIVPHAETQPMFSQEARRVTGGDIVGHDYSNPESAGIRNLIASVYEQLPEGDFNVPLLGLEAPSALEDARLALFGETLGDNHVAGLFEEDVFASICGVLVYTLSPPDVHGTQTANVAEFWANPKATRALGVTAIDDLLEAMRAAFNA